MRQGCSNLDGEMGILLSGNVSASESVFGCWAISIGSLASNLKAAVCFMFLFRSPKFYLGICSLGDSGGSVFQNMDSPPLF